MSGLGWKAGLNRTLRTVIIGLSILTYLSMAPIGYLVFWLVSVLPTRDELRRARRVQAVLRLAFGFVHSWLRWVRTLDFDHHELPGEPLPRGPCVVVANHPTYADWSAILATIGGLCVPVKPHLYRQFWLRPLLRAARQMEGGEDLNPLDGGRVVDESVSRLNEGFRVLVFPEGTRSPPGELGRFGRAAFEIACRAKVPIVPLHITCEPLWLTKEDSVFRPPAVTTHLQLRALRCIDPAEFGHDSRAIRRHVEAMYGRLIHGVVNEEEPWNGQPKQSPSATASRSS